MVAASHGQDSQGWGSPSPFGRALLVCARQLGAGGPPLCLTFLPAPTTVLPSLDVAAHIQTVTTTAPHLEHPPGATTVTATTTPQLGRCLVTYMLSRTSGASSRCNHCQHALYCGQTCAPEGGPLALTLY